MGPYRYADCGTNNIPLATAVTKTAVATLARLAGVRRLAVGEPPRRTTSLPSPVSCSPNPFTDRTVIGYAAQCDAVMPRIVVYDLLGRFVKRIGPAASPVIWTGEDASGRRVTAGVYFIRVVEDGAESWQRVVKTE